MHFTVAFDDTDAEGIVFFGNYFRMAHRALEKYLPLIDIPWAEWFKSPEYGCPLVHAEADFTSPMRAGDPYLAKLTVKEVGNSSVHFQYEFSRDGKITAKLLTSHVFMDRKKREKMDIPQSIRARLEAAPKSS